MQTVKHALTQKQSMRVAAVTVAVVLSAGFAAAPDSQASERLPTKAFVYDAKQTALTDLLRDFAGSIGLPIVIAEGVTGTVNSKFTLTPRAFLDLISRSFGLIWYHDGTALHIYPSNQIQSRIYKLNAPQAVNIKSRLLAFGLLDGRYPVRLMNEEGPTLIFAAGPPRHIQLIDALLEATASDEREVGPELIRSFQLTHASAVDRVTQGVMVPGVATILGKFLGQAGGGSGGEDGPLGAGVSGLVSNVSQATESMVASTAALTGTPEARGRRNDAISDAVNSLKGGGVQQGAPLSSRDANPLRVVTPPPPEKRKAARATFSADEATNMILVRATAEQMGDIESLIAKLDVPRSMIEVEATIIDISSDQMQSLGFDWRFNSNSGVRELALSPGIATTTTSGAIPQGGGYNITTLLASGGRELLARIRALEASGSARVVSQPKVLGAANRTAVLSDKRTASVRVAGNQDARLYSVETGTTLRVTPRLIQQGDVTRIGMELLIEDGGFSSQSVDDVPIAQRTSITTIATLNEGQALLVGGIEVEGSSSGRSGIPLLSRLPLIGALFRVDSSQSSRRQRLFLITPKRVQLDVPASAAAPAAAVAAAASAVVAAPASDTEIDR
jgi:type III secretion protein C